MYAFFLLFLLASCSTMLSDKNTYHIKSNPSATVKVISHDSPLGEVLGMTPLDIKASQLEHLTKKGQWYFLKLEMPGYVSENITLDKSSKQTSIEIQLHPVEWWNDPTKQLSSRIAHQIGQTVRNNLIKQYPSAAIFYDIQGSLFVLKNQSDMAISSYEKSVQMESTNAETIKLLEELKKGKNP